MSDTKKTLTILHLYPRDMNIYGDYGNILVLKQRAKWHGYKPEIIEYNPGDNFPKNVDIVVGGGGQDSGQDKIQADLHKIGPTLQKLANSDTPMLVICGLYQLFGQFFQTQDKHIIKGIGILDIETIAKSERLIGNVTIRSKQFGDVIGYENHSGQTFLNEGAKPLGTVIRGTGNNSKDMTEGACTNNVIGSYLHGSLLPKNPKIADWLIEQAATKKYGSFKPGNIDDSLVPLAREHAMKRPR